MEMPVIKTVGDACYWEYAKLIAGDAPESAKNAQSVMNTYSAFKTGMRKFTAPLFEDLDMTRSRCAICCNQEDLTEEPLVPRRGCVTSDIHNTVRLCRGCKSAKGDRDLLEWWGAERNKELHPALRRKYLRMIYLCHECRGLLNREIKYREADLSELAQVFKSPCFSFHSKVHRDMASAE